MRLLIFTFILIASSVFATTPDSLKQKKWAIGLTYSPDFCYRVSYEKSSFLALANIKESPKYGFTSGVNILYQLLDRVGVEFGVLYNNKGEKMYSNSSSSSTWTTPDGTSASYAIKETKSTLAYQYLEIPLKINVNLVNKNKLRLFPSLGCSMNVFMGKHAAMGQPGFGGSFVKYCVLLPWPTSHPSRLLWCGYYFVWQPQMLPVLF